MSDTFDPYCKWLDIPPEEQPADHYRLLGIEQFESDTKLIKKAAEAKIEYLRTFQLSKRFSFLKKLMAEVASARVCLLNNEKKAAYDAQLRGHSETAQDSAPVRPGDAMTERMPPRGEQSQRRRLGGSATALAPKKVRSRWKKNALPLQIILGVVTVILIVAAFLLLSKQEQDKQPSNNITRRKMQTEDYNRQLAVRKRNERSEQAKQQNPRRRAIGEKEHIQKTPPPTVGPIQNPDVPKPEAAKPDAANREAEEEAERKAKEEAERTTKVSYYGNGQKKSEFYYKNGKKDGLYTWWHENGQKKSEGHYKNGKKWVMTYWDENGQKRLESHYKDGKQEGLWTQRHKNGQKKSEGHYKNGKRDGLWTVWNENGQKWLEKHYKDGLKDGLETEWDENGQKEIEIQYKDDEEISRIEF